MLITNTFSWPVTSWPASTSATQYTVFQVYPTPVTTIATTTTNSATLTYDENNDLIFQARPSLTDQQGNTTYGPECGVQVVNYAPCRAYLRNNIRLALYDRTDKPSAKLIWPDDELNRYINDAIGELNRIFPLEEQITIPLMYDQRDYTLPTDFFACQNVQYVTQDGNLHYYLIEKPFRGGESTATSYVGYPKLGILLNPMAGRYYPGHYDIFENALHIDWDPYDNNDTLIMRYYGKRPFPIADADVIAIDPEDITILSLYVQVSAWMRVEGQDTALSRFRDKSDGSRRDDMPTLKQSQAVLNLYDRIIAERKALRPRVIRLVRR